jgi:hypothetical protein
MNFSKQFKTVVAVTFAVVATLSACGGGNTGPSADPLKTTCLPTKAAFDKLYFGMNYQQAVSIVGCEGSLAKDTTEDGARVQYYEWGDLNAQKPSMVKLYVAFENGVTTSKRRMTGSGLL